MEAAFVPHLDCPEDIALLHQLLQGGTPTHLVGSKSWDSLAQQWNTFVATDIAAGQQTLRRGTSAKYLKQFYETVHNRTSAHLTLQPAAAVERAEQAAAAQAATVALTPQLAAASLPGPPRETEGMPPCPGQDQQQPPPQQQQPPGVPGGQGSQGGRDGCGGGRGAHGHHLCRGCRCVVTRAARCNRSCCFQCTGHLSFTLFKTKHVCCHPALAGTF